MRDDERPPPPKRRIADEAAFRRAFERAVAVKVAMTRLEMIFTGERRPPGGRRAADG